MVLASIIICYFIAIEVGKRNKTFNNKHYFIAALLALIPVIVGLYYMFTMKQPTLY
jgi:hypothetical protein